MYFQNGWQNKENAIERLLYVVANIEFFRRTFFYAHESW